MDTEDVREDSPLISFPFLLEITPEIGFSLSQNVELSGQDILLFLEAEEMSSIQSDVEKDWRNFRGSKARALVIEFHK